MSQAQDGVFPEHAGAGVAHHGADLFAASLLITVHRAFRACRLVRTKSAPVEPNSRVIEQCPAFRTYAISSRVLIATIDPDHQLERSPFAFESGERRQRLTAELDRAGHACPLAARGLFRNKTTLKLYQASRRKLDLRLIPA